MLEFSSYIICIFLSLWRIYHLLYAQSKSPTPSESVGHLENIFGGLFFFVGEKVLRGFSISRLKLLSLQTIHKHTMLRGTGFVAGNALTLGHCWLSQAISQVMALGDKSMWEPHGEPGVEAAKSVRRVAHQSCWSVPIEDQEGPGCRMLSLPPGLPLNPHHCLRACCWVREEGE